ncbi:MAG: PKD domain-containing protein [Candidatus Paceibacterota bacterium]|jgi:hypothetical protein
MSKNKFLFFLFSIFLSIFLFVSVFVNNAYASVDKIVFINEPQTINVGEFSKQYQIQLQNTSGDKEIAPDTTYFTLPLDTGLFYSKTDGEPFTASSSIYIATGSSNKYFYFKSNTGGEYTIKVYARNKDNTKQWETEQIVKVTDATTTEVYNNTNNTSTTTNVAPSPSIIIRKVYVSVHSSAEDLSNYDEKTPFEITAGRERVATIGSPIEFDAKYTLLQKGECTPNFKWSFGDGFESVGKNTIHTYKYAGEYQVVLNGSCGEYVSISRAVVKVVSTDISISSLINGDIEIINNDKTEINIGNWKMKGEQIDFLFPRDTIISANNKIILSKEDLKIGNSVNRIYLNNPLGGEVAFVDIKILNKNEAASSQEMPDVKIISVGNFYISVAEAERLIKEYKEKLALNIQSKENIGVIKESIINNIDEPNRKDMIQTASVMEAVNSSSTKGFWAKIIDIPVKSIKSFVRTFYDF